MVNAPGDTTEHPVSQTVPQVETHQRPGVLAASAASDASGLQRLLAVLGAAVTDLRALALFRLDDAGPVLVGSRYVDRHALACVGEAYEAHRKGLLAGSAAYVRRDEAAASNGCSWCPPRAILVVPALWGEPSRLVGLLYMDSAASDPWSSEVVKRVECWSPLAGKLLSEAHATKGRRADPQLARLPIHEDSPPAPHSPAARPDEEAVLRGAVLYGLERHGWHLDVVARWMGVTRTTLWKTCQRLGITRESFERQQIVASLERYGGDVVRVCTALRVSRAALLARMTRLRMALPRVHQATLAGDRESKQRRDTLQALQEHDWNMPATAKALGLSVSAVWARRGRFGLHKKRQPAPSARVRRRC